MVAPKSTVTTGAIGTGNTLEIPAPANISEGDVLVAFIKAQGNNTPDAVPPTGWQRIGVPYDGAAGARVLSAFAKTATTSEPSSYVFTIQARAVGGISLWSGSEVALDVVGTCIDYRGWWDNSIPGRRMDSYVAYDDAVAFVLAGNGAVDGISHVPTYKPPSYTELFNTQTGTGTTGSRDAIWVGYKEITGPVAPATEVLVDSEAVGWQNGTTSGDGIQGVALRRLDTPTGGNLIRKFTADDLTSQPLAPGVIGTGDTSWDIVSGDWRVDPTQGLRPPAIQLVKEAGIAPAIHWTSIGDVPQSAGRVYVRLSGAPSGTATFISAMDNANGRIFDLALLSTARLRFHDPSNAQVGTLPVMSLDTWYRVEWVQNLSGVTVYLYEGESTSALGSVVWSGSPLPLNRFRIAINSSSVTVSDLWVDDIAISDTAELIGPVVTSLPPTPVKRWNGSTYIDQYTYRWDGTTSSYVLIEGHQV